MPLQIVRNDITKMECDAIVNAANSSLAGGGGVDGAIHRAAGRKLHKACKQLGGCQTGETKITCGYRLPAKYVIHTVGPIWQGGGAGEKALLENCYRNSLSLAETYHCESVAFPLISTGVYGYPMQEAFRIAVNTVSDFLMHSDMMVYIVVYNRSALSAGHKLFTDIAQYIDDCYVDEQAKFDRRQGRNYNRSLVLNSDDNEVCCSQSMTDMYAPTPTVNLDDFLKNTIDESFSEMLLRLIDEKGMKDSECYKKANIDKRLFSKIRSNPDYKPSKPTVLAFCIALELPLAMTNEMLMKAGFALSHSYKLDIIVEYFIKHNNYNIFEINEVLFAFDQVLLGSVN